MRGRFTHAAVALFMAGSMVVTPLYAQSPQAPAPAAPTPDQPRMQTPPPQYKPPTETQGPPVAPTRSIPLGPHDFSRPWFPNIIGPYEGVHVAEPVLTNTPTIRQLIQNGKLMLSLEDAISLGLENNLAIAVERYQPALDEANLLLARSGANGRTSFDPSVTSTLSMEQADTPFNNPFFAGIATQLTSPIGVQEHVATENFQYTQGFATGTQAQVTFDNSRSSTNFGGFDLFNPYFNTSMTVELTQPLLNGFGKLPNERYIIEAKNTVKVGESQFRQQVITSVTQIATDYWELVYAREAVKVEQVTVAADEQLYDNNKKQEQIGTMAPLDVIDAQSQLATDQQALVQAQTVQLLDQTNLLVAITKDPLAAPLQGVEIVPTTPLYNPQAVDTSLPDAVAVALQNRPEIEQALLNLKNAGIEIKVTKNGLLPTLNLFAEYQTAGLSGVIHPTIETGNFEGTTPIFATNGPIAPGTPPTGYVGAELAIPGTPITQGIGSSWSSMVHGDYSTYEAGLNLTLPIRNRSAQAAYATAQINQRQQEVNYMETRATIIQGVRQALITLEQDRAAVAAAQEARIYNQQSYDDEVKKLQLGTSTAFTVVQKQQLLTVAEGTELRDRINLIEAELNYEQALGKTLQDHNIGIQGVMAGNANLHMNIPGAPDKTLP
jgi:outer membrane protein